MVNYKHRYSLVIDNLNCFNYLKMPPSVLFIIFTTTLLLPNALRWPSTREDIPILIFRSPISVLKYEC